MAEPLAETLCVAGSIPARRNICIVYKEFRVWLSVFMSLNVYKRTHNTSEMLNALGVSYHHELAIVDGNHGNKSGKVKRNTNVDYLRCTG